jgi:hypothetical protein
MNESQRIDHAYHEDRLLLLIARNDKLPAKVGWQGRILSLETVVDGCTLYYHCARRRPGVFPGASSPSLVVHTLAALTLFVLPKWAHDTAKAEMTHRGIEHLR